MRALVLTVVVAALAALSLSAPRAAAQRRAATDRPVDRVVAVVGTRPILASQVEEQLVLAQSQGVKVPEDSAGKDAARRQILSQMVDEELLVQQAERDTTIKVTDQEVQDAVEQTVQNVRKQFTSIPEFQAQLRAAGFVSEEEWRRWLADQQRRAILQQRLIEGLKQKGKLRPIAPSDAEMRAFWESNREQQALRPGAISDVVRTEFGFHIIQVERAQPAEIMARHILIQPTISAAQIAIARRQADSVHDALAHGASFDTLARRYADPSEPKLADALPVSQLPPDYDKAIGPDTVPGLKPVFEVGIGSPRPRFVVFELMRRLPEGELGFDEVKDRIREALGQQLAIKHHLDLLRRTTYVDVRF